MSFDPEKPTTEAPAQEEVPVAHEKTAEKRTTDLARKENLKRIREGLIEREPSPERRRKLIREMHLERFLQAGAEMIHKMEELALQDPKKTGARLYAETELYMREKNLPFLTPQREMLASAARLWNERKAGLQRYFEETSNFSQLDFTAQQPFEFGPSTSLEELNRTINSDPALKMKVLADMGDHLKIKEISELAAVEIDAASRYPAIIVKVSDPALWNRKNKPKEDLDAGPQESTGTGIFYIANQNETLPNLGIYAATKMARNIDGRMQAEDVEAQKVEATIGHEWKHFARHNFISPAVREYIAHRAGQENSSQRKKTGEIKKEDLREIEARVGMAFDDKFLHGSSPEVLGVGGKIHDENRARLEKAEGPKIESNLAVNDRFFWDYVQDEYVAYLENEGRVSNQGSLGFISDVITEEIIKGNKLIPEETLRAFNSLHDTVVIRINAGIDPKELSAAIKTSVNPETAYRRIKQAVPLGAEDIRKAIDATGDFSFRNFNVFMLMAQSHGLGEKLAKKLSPGDITDIFLTGMGEIDKLEVAERLQEKDDVSGQRKYLSLEHDLAAVRRTIPVLENLKAQITLAYSDDLEASVRTKMLWSFNRVKEYLEVAEGRERILSEIQISAEAGRHSRKNFALKIFLKMTGGGDLLQKEEDGEIRTNSIADLGRVLDAIQQFDRLSPYFVEGNHHLLSEEEGLIEKWLEAGEGIRQTVEADIAKRGGKGRVNAYQILDILEQYQALYQERGLDPKDPYPGRLLADSPKEMLIRSTGRFGEILDRILG